MSDAHPDDEPGPAAPSWASSPTMPWSRPVPGPLHDQAADIFSPAPPKPPAASKPPAAQPDSHARPDPRARTVTEARPMATRPTAEPTPPTEPMEPTEPTKAREPAAPPVSAPPVPLESETESEAPTAAEPPAPDAERILAEYRWRFDPDTLREVVDATDLDVLVEVRRLLTAKLDGISDNGPRARLLSLRAVVSRILGHLEESLADGELALKHAEATGELRRIAIAQARLAHVLHWRGEYAEADRLFTLANSTELPDRLRGAIFQHLGKCAYDQGRFIEACNDFERALQLRGEEDPDLIAQTEMALDAVFRRVAEAGWGPYPRSRDDLLQVRKALTATFDEHTRRWGFTDELGIFRIPPRFTDAQPFREGVAWVRRPGAPSWALVDDGGELLIDHTAGYLGVGNFSEGVAWVSHDGANGWIAIDKANTVLVSAGFDDVRPFRRGRASVRRGGRWGAVDPTGRLIVPLHYDGFVTALYDGRYIDGFNDEGLAVVALGNYKGVVDRDGHLIVPPVHRALVIHPVAFLITDRTQRWGALDRRGRPLLEPRFATRTDVTDELDRLLSDARPVL